MKREMKSNFFKGIILCTAIIFFTSCSFFQEKKVEIATPKEVYTAIFLDDSYSLNRYLSEGFPVDYRDSDGKTLLMSILENNSLKSLTAILDRNVDTEAKDGKGRTAIFYVRSLEALEKLVAAGANVDIISESGTPLLTIFIKDKPISYSIFLIESGADYNSRDRKGWNSLFWAAASGELEIVKALKNMGGDFSTLDEKGNYPIYYTYDENTLLELLDGINYNLKLKNLQKENILGEVYLRSVANGYISVVKRLFELGVNLRYTSYGDSALSIAKKMNNSKMIKFLNDNNIK